MVVQTPDLLPKEIITKKIEHLFGDYILTSCSLRLRRFAIL